MKLFNKGALIIAGVLLDAASRAQAGGLISNSKVALGVRTCAALNEKYSDAFGWGVSDPANKGYVGIRDGLTGTVTGLESGCLCESWTAMVRSSYGTYPLWCGDSAREGEKNIACEFTNDHETATSYGFCRMPDQEHQFLHVTHDFGPSSQAWLYEINVTIVNPTSHTHREVLYSRIMDWDIDPSPFQEYVTIQGTKQCPAVEVAHDNGFCSVDPNAPCSGLLFTGDAVDVGPRDHGAYFKFNLGSLGPKEEVKFTIYYGVSQWSKVGSAEQTALNALAAVGADVYTLGQNKLYPLNGEKHTFIFAYKCCQDPKDYKFDCETVSHNRDYYCRFDIVKDFCPHLCWSLDCDGVARDPKYYCMYPWIKKNCPCACDDYGSISIDPILGDLAHSRTEDVYPVDPTPIDPTPIDRSPADRRLADTLACLQENADCDPTTAGTDSMPCCPSFTCDHTSTCVVDMEGPLKSRESNDPDWLNKNFDADCGKLQKDSDALCKEEFVRKEAKIYCPDTVSLCETHQK